MQSKNNIRHQLFTKEDKESIFRYLETDEDFFNEVFEAIMTFTSSDSRLITQVTHALKTDYKELYINIRKDQHESEKKHLPPCCRTD